MRTSVANACASPQRAAQTNQRTCPPLACADRGSEVFDGIGPEHRSAQRQLGLLLRFAPVAARGLRHDQAGGPPLTGADLLRAASLLDGRYLGCGLTMSHTNDNPPGVAPPTLGGVRISDNAVARYVERLRPAIDTEAAHAELETLMLQHGSITDSPPSWTRDAQARSHYVLVGDSIVLPLAHDHRGRWAATTCLTPGTLTDVERRQRADRRRSRSGR